MINSKRKGNQGERDWAYFLRDSNLDKKAWRNKGSGSSYIKSDVLNSLQYLFEVKVGKHIPVLSAIKQSTRDAEMSQTIPSVPFRYDYMSEFWIMIPAWHWAELYKKSQQPKTENPDRDLRQKLDLLQYKSQDIIRELEKLELQDKTLLYNIKNFKTLLRETISRIK